MKKLYYLVVCNGIHLNEFEDTVFDYVVQMFENKELDYATRKSVALLQDYLQTADNGYEYKAISKDNEIYIIRFNKNDDKSEIYDCQVILLIK